ncbi:MAG: hypothetical protein ACP5NP_14075 [Acetobacteraceae bacterium]
MTRLFPLLLPVLLAGCAFGAPPRSVTARDTATACRRQAEATYQLQHRDDLYQIGNQDAPRSGAAGLTLPMQGLADRYEQERFLARCENDVGTGTALHP